MDPKFKDRGFSEQKEQGRAPSAELEKEETGLVTVYKMTHTCVCASNTLEVALGTRSQWWFEAQTTEERR